MCPEPQPPESSPPVVAPSPGAPFVDTDLFCPKCGYNIRGVEGAKCPECGGDIQLAHETDSQIPWVYRKEQGRVISYWNTMLLLTFRNQKFCLEISRPVELASARRFRRITLLLAWIPVLLATVWRMHVETVPIASEIYFIIALGHIGFLAFLAAITILPYYTLYREETEPLTLQRGAILTLYCCAPLAWMFVPVLLFVAGQAVTVGRHSDLDLILNLSGGGALYLVAMIEFVDTLRIRGEVLGSRTRSGARWVQVKFITLWAFAGFTCGVGIPLGIFFLVHIYFSVR